MGDNQSHSHSHSHDHSHDHSHSHSHDHGMNKNTDDNCEEDHLNEEQEEQKHFQLIVSTLLNYSQYGLHWVKRMQDFYHYKLTDEEKELLPNYLVKMDALAKAVLINSRFLKLIGNEHTHIFVNDEKISNVDRDQVGQIKIDYFMMDQLQSSMRQLVREWSAQGKKERDQSFGPILKELSTLYSSVAKKDRAKIKVYCPGSGLARLCLEIASLGFSCQGIEYSYLMLILSNFMLNQCKKVNEFTIHPYIHQSVNVLRDTDQVRPIQIPDVLAGDMLPKFPNQEFSMAAGDFTENIIPDSFDVVVTCFFIDTAKNILHYVDCISKILKKGGYWINFGPLLYHHANKSDSIELSYEQLRHVISKKGFTIKKEELKEAEYSSNSESLLKSVYKCQYFLAVNNK